jgi:hypothetical protein
MQIDGQAVQFVTLMSAVTDTTPSTPFEVAGNSGAKMVEIAAVGTVAGHAVTLQFEGSYDKTNWYLIGSQQVDATAAPTRTAAAFTLTPGNATLRHVYQLLDAYVWLRVNPTANTLGTGLTAKAYLVPV